MRPRRPQEAPKTRIPLASGGSWPPRGPKRPPRRPKRPPRGRQDPPRWPQGGQHGSMLASNMEPKPKKNRWKLDRKCDTSWNRFLGWFWWIFRGKMSQNRREVNGKIGRTGDVSWCRFLEGFRLILRPHQRKIDGKIDRESYNRKENRCRNQSDKRSNSKVWESTFKAFKVLWSTLEYLKDLDSLPKYSKVISKYSSSRLWVNLHPACLNLHPWLKYYK